MSVLGKAYLMTATAVLIGLCGLLTLAGALPRAIQLVSAVVGGVVALWFRRRRA